MFRGNEEIQWFVVLTNPQREAFVEEQLYYLKPYLPRFKNIKRRVVPLFPGYLFVPAVEHWGAISNTVGVRDLLKSGDHPACVSDMVIRHWRSKERGGLVQLPPPPRFTSGEKLTILRGSLRHRIVIHAAMIGRDRERVLIEMLGQHVSIIVASADLAPFTSRAPRNSLRFQRETFTGRSGARFQEASCRSF